MSDPLSIRLLYSPHVPTDRQHVALLCDDLERLEVFYGGAAGGGKSDWLLMAALRYVDVPGYSALVLRKTFAELNLPGAIMDRAKEWLAGVPGVKWVERDFRFTFPSGATLSFGYLQTAGDRYRYQGAEFQFVGFDELTHFEEADYRYLFSRLRRPSLVDDRTGEPLELDPEERARRELLARVPLRMRSASNPGGRGHEWVLRRLVERKVAPRVEGEPPDPLDTPERAALRVFVPARLDDNPYVDRDAYEDSLGELDPYTRQRLLAGDWYARPPGDYVYEPDHLAAAFALGDELDELLARGTIPPPAGELLALGFDLGEHTHILVGWPLEGGGLYVVAERALRSAEPTDVAAHAFGRRRQHVDNPEEERELDGILDTVYELGSRPRPANLPPALPPGKDPLELVAALRYDAAGVQTMRAVSKAARRRVPGTRTTAVSFGAPAPQSGKATARKSYKAETLGFLRGLARRAAEGKRTRVLAVGARCPELRRQLGRLEWEDREAGKVKKGDDHGPDALVALAAPDAIRHR